MQNTTIMRNSQIRKYYNILFRITLYRPFEDKKAIKNGPHIKISMIEWRRHSTWHVRFGCISKQKKIGWCIFQGTCRLGEDVLMFNKTKHTHIILIMNQQPMLLEIVIAEEISASRTSPCSETYQHLPEKKVLFGRG